MAECNAGALLAGMNYQDAGAGLLIFFKRLAEFLKAPLSLSSMDALRPFDSLPRDAVAYPRPHISLSEWQPRQQVDGSFLYQCNVCRDGRERQRFRIAIHEATDVHQTALRAFNTSASTLMLSGLEDAISARVLTDDALHHLLSLLTSNPNEYPPYPSTSRHDSYSEPNFPGAQSSSDLPSHTGINWFRFSALEDTQAADLSYQEMGNYVSEKLLDLVNGDNELLHEQDGQNDEVIDETSSDEASSFDDSCPNKYARVDQKSMLSDLEWYPWQDRITCSLDILMHLPQSVFSQKQLDLFLWLLRVNRVELVPSTKSMNLLNKMMQGNCRIDTIAYEGRLDHRYHVNGLSQILAQEMCNPKIRPNLYFYPEDTGLHLSQTRQAERQLKEICSEDTTPMIRIHHSDYYIFEPAMLAD